MSEQPCRRETADSIVALLQQADPAWECLRALKRAPLAPIEKRRGRSTHPHIVDWIKNNCKNMSPGEIVAEIYKQFNHRISESTAYRIHDGKKTEFRTFTPEEIAWIRENCIDCTNAQSVERFKQRWGFSISVATIQVYVRGLRAGAKRFTDDQTKFVADRQGLHIFTIQDEFRRKFGLTISASGIYNCWKNRRNSE